MYQREIYYIPVLLLFFALYFLSCHSQREANALFSGTERDAGTEQVDKGLMRLDALLYFGKSLGKFDCIRYPATRARWSNNGFRLL
ncbi:MAG: hypothetical protein QM654_06995 [Dysgonamonadaceae bacterium]